MTSRELTLSLVAITLLCLTGSANRAPADVLPQIPPDPAAAAVPTPRPARVSPPATTPATKAPATKAPATKQPATAPRVPIVGTAPRRPAPVQTNDHPVKLAVADLDISLEVKATGVTKKGEMEIPETIAEVGWYRYGSFPSSKTGTTVLAAHVDTRHEGVGPFSRLREAKVGAAVTVVDEDGDKHNYKVAAVTKVDKAKVNWRQVFTEGGHPRLVMITCGGAYDQDSGYRDNVLVTAFPDP